MKKINLFILVLLTLSILCSCADTQVLSTTAAVDAAVNRADGMLTVSYIDVGQADSILITTPDNKNMLIDAGEGEGYNGAVLSYLKEAGITSLDTVIATHPHSDHISAMDEVLNAMTVTNFYMPNVSHTTKDFENMLNALEKVPNIFPAKEGINFNPGNKVNCEILSPVSDSYRGLNDYSIVLKLSYGNTAFLFTGDAENLVEKQILDKGKNIKANVLKCGHHGSSTSTSSEFINAVNPEYAVLSYDKNNDYGHPHKEVIDRLNKNKITILETEKSGTITFKSDGQRVTLVNSHNKTNTDSYTELTTITAVQTQATTQEEKIYEIYIGNKNSKKYHTIKCNSLPAQKNRVLFNSKEQAQEQGYTPCKSCNK